MCIKRYVGFFSCGHPDQGPDAIVSVEFCKRAHSSGVVCEDYRWFRMLSQQNGALQHEPVYPQCRPGWKMIWQDRTDTLENSRYVLRVLLSSGFLNSRHLNSQDREALLATFETFPAYLDDAITKEAHKGSSNLSILVLKAGWLSLKRRIEDAIN
ncbi:hypothetical protein BKA67DRAFT_642547 [Truncatella angustata]|uniref:Uncharacterized protein n=1 Tax=Truncatella angustata TaxID=152316 RepID=A0A9P8UQX4_9PEZI|nr:uncharacterized protein BKA67DRAFT_642547 [Truncatella angustata]KAH6656400.1 hypothetical protein BKA67DRAFT_642547 [Truncatella angustata]